MADKTNKDQPTTKVVDKERRNHITIQVGDAFVKVESDDSLDECKKHAEEVMSKVKQTAVNYIK